MFNIFKIIGYALKAKKGYSVPNELLAETSFGLIEGFFILSFIIIGVLGGGLVFSGIYFGYTLLTIFGSLFLLILGVDIYIYQKLKKIFTNFSNKITDRVKERMDNFHS